MRPKRSTAAFASVGDSHITKRFSKRTIAGSRRDKKARISPGFSGEFTARVC
jgi:hypothetical protein